MKKLNFLLLLLFAFFLTSCDPSQNIVFINKGKSEAKVKLIVNSKFKNEAPDEEALAKVIKGDSIVFHIKPGNTKENESFIYFGRGRWREDQILEISKSINSIEIENADKKVVYKSQEAINNLFLNNKSGILFKSIDISIDEDFGN